MKFLRLYLRVLESLGREARLGWGLAIADVALACAMFVEPILFGRIVDTLAGSQGHAGDLSWSSLLALVVTVPAHAAWHALDELSHSGATVSAMAVDLGDNHVIGELHGEQRLTPASLTKLATAAAALASWRRPGPGCTAPPAAR